MRTGSNRPGKLQRIVVRAGLWLALVPACQTQALVEVTIRYDSSFAPQQLRLVKFIDGELAGRRETMADRTPANADALIYKYGIKVPADGTEVDF